MPEVLTKYPDIVLQILNESGAECAMGAPQQILTACPPERFCSLPTGELCVYGVHEISEMTQISITELTQGISNSNAVMLVGAFVLGIGISILFKKIKWKKEKK